MQNKGLCNNCVKDKHCSTPRKFPVFLCEEFEIEKLEISELELQEPGGIGMKKIKAAR
jgi:hypothetical protein